MQVQVKVRSTFEGTTYEPGVHEMPDSYLEHWFFLAQVQNGTFTVGPAAALKTTPVIVPAPGVDQPRTSLGEDAFKNILAKGFPTAPSDGPESVIQSVYPDVSAEVIATPDAEEVIVTPDASKNKKGSK